MSDEITESEMTVERQDELRAEVKRLMGAEKLNLPRVATMSGMKYGTIAPWMAGTYTGNNTRVALDVQKWLAGHAAKARTRATLPRAPGFLLTPTAGAFIYALEYAHHTPTMALIAGGPGVGKTESIRYYAASAPNVWVMAAKPSVRTPHALLEELCEVLDVTERAASRRSRSIVARVRGANGLLVVDEAQHLGVSAMDELRSIHDATGVGIALSGNEGIYATLDGLGRKKEFAQLFSRIGIRVSRPTPQSGDVAMLLGEWEHVEEDARQYLRALAQKPGALRGMTMTMRMAHVMMTASELPTITRAMVEGAWKKLGGDVVVALTA